MWKLLHDKRRTRDDQGFSIANVIVAMVIIGVLGSVIGFAAFQLIGESRETVLAANIRTAANAVQNTLALNPEARGTPGADGKPSAELISELANVASFEWDTTWEMQDTDGAEKVNIQTIHKAAAKEAEATGTSVAPAVQWLVASGDAVRLMIRNDDGAWACALVVMRPDWTLSNAVAVEGNLRGVWYDAGAGYTADDDNGLHFCSPTITEDANFVTTGTFTRPTGSQYDGWEEYTAPGHFGNDNAGETGSTTAHKAPLPVSGSTWNFPAVDTAGSEEAPRSYGRTVPDFAA